MRLLTLLVFLSSVATAQRFVPLMEHEQLAGPTATTEVALRVDCGQPELPGIERLTSGGNRTLRIDLDTVGLGSDLTDYRCVDCDPRFGTVTITNDTVLYTADAGVEQGFDTLGITVCSPGGVCADTVQLVVLVQRPGRTTELAARTLDPQEIDTVSVPDGNLPGGTVCRTITSCSDDYAGRGQNAYFFRRVGSANDFVYQSGRYGGTDAVCVTLCNEFGLCDTLRTTFTIQRATVSLPFFDDFSYEGVRPSVELWQDADVLVNRNYGANPPSIGVATFDAVDFSGQPYEASGSARRTQPRDYLTSAPIALAGKNGSVLSFFLQARGLGNRPELQDSFLVQFLDPSGTWNTVFAESGLLNTVGNTTAAPFVGRLVSVPSAYEYDGFQFRFVNLSSERGAVDNWNVDYVKLSNTSTTLITQDLALMQAPFRLVAPYTSLPVRHLQAAGAELLADTIELDLWNHRADITPVTQSTYTIENLGSPPFASSGGLFPSSFFGQDNGIAADTFELRTATFSQLPTATAVSNFLLGLDPAGDYRLRTTYTLTVATEDATFDPAIARNNRASQVTELADYMAYDDGSAEVAIEGQPGNTILQRYRAYVPDRLTGIRIRLPRGLGGVGDQLLNLVVYGGGTDSLPGELLYSAEEPILYAEDVYRDSTQAFTSYALTEPVDLPVGDFYVGWRQPTADRSLPVGFDRNSQTSGGQFFNSGNGFQVLEGATRGAIMIRPLLEGAAVMPTSTDDEPTTTLVSIYPNPTNGLLNVEVLGNADAGALEYRLFSVGGQLLGQGKGVRTIDLQALPTGVYLLECRVGERVGRHKVVKR